MTQNYLKILLLLQLFLPLENIGANNPVYPNPGLTPIASEGNDSSECRLPQAQFFHTTAIGPDYAAFAWSPVSGADYYLLEAYESGTQNLVATKIAYGTSAVMNLPPSGPYDVSLTAMSVECRKNLNKVWIEGLTLIVVELIVEANGPLNGGMMSERLSPGECISLTTPEFTNYFLDVRYHDLHLSYASFAYNCASCLLAMSIGRVDEALDIKGDLAGDGVEKYDPPYLSDISNALISSPGGEHICKITFYKMPNPLNQEASILEICFPFINEEAGYSVYWGSAVEGHGGRSQAYSDGQGDSPMTATVQNPFSGAIQVHLQTKTDSSKNSDVHFRLCSPDGKVIEDETIPFSPEFSITVPYLPTGLYLLQLESAGFTQTFKLIKPD